MYRDSPVYDFFTEFLPGLLGTIIALGVSIFLLAVACTYIFSAPSCRAYGEKMQIETDWGFQTGCMISVQGQWLPWSEVVPVERNGKIVFAPKPYIRLGEATSKN